MIAQSYEIEGRVITKSSKILWRRTQSIWTRKTRKIFALKSVVSVRIKF